MFDRIMEWLASHGSLRFQTFRDARRRHEAYMMAHGIGATALEALSPQQRQEAQSSRELTDVESQYEQVMELTRREGTVRDVSIVAQQLGLLHYMRGDLGQAGKFYAESLSILGDLPRLGVAETAGISTCRCFLSLIALEQGDRAAARGHILKAMEIDQHQNDSRSVEMDRRILNRCEGGA